MLSKSQTCQTTKLCMVYDFLGIWYQAKEISHKVYSNIYLQWRIFKFHKGDSLPHTVPSRTLHTGVVMAIDLEAQQHLYDWISKVKHALRNNQQHAPNNLGFYILKMPEYYRQPSADFTPIGWRFGLHNREKLNTSGSEAIKLSVAIAFELVGQKWEDFCENVVTDKILLLIKQCYGLREEETIFTDKVFRYILALDALFLAVKTDRDLPHGEQLLWTNATVRMVQDALGNSGNQRWDHIESLDLCKIENQVPFILIIKVVEYMIQGRAPTPANNESYMRKLIEIGARRGACQVMDVSGDSFKTPSTLNSPSSTWKHFLAIAYELICGEKGMERRSDKSIKSYLHIPSASKLRFSGIIIEAISGPLHLLSYNNGCLRLPKMYMYDCTLGIARNIAWYETTQDGHCMFHDYILLMENLIQTPMDFEILVECGVFSKCGLTAPIAVTHWSQLNVQGLVQRRSSKEHHNMKKTISKRCKLRRYKLWSEFRTEFCSKPWIVISVLTITLVSAATLIQTYVAVISSNRMKPQFP